MGMGARQPSAVCPQSKQHFTISWQGPATMINATTNSEFNTFSNEIELPGRMQDATQRVQQALQNMPG